MKIEPSRLNRVTLQETQEVLPVYAQRSSNYKGIAQAGEFLLPPLELGQELSAVVAEELADGRLVLNLGGTLIEADNPGGVSAGQVLRLRVELLEPQVVLHIIEQVDSAATEAAKLLRQHLPEVFGQRLSLDMLQAQLAERANFDDTGAAIPWLTKLKDFLSGVLHNEEPWTAAQLKQFVQDSGLQYEAKLFQLAARNPDRLNEAADNDLKGLLLGALKELNVAAPGSEARKAVADQLTQLESRQAANLLAQLEGQAFQLQVPLFSGTEFSSVSLSVERDGSRRSDESGETRCGYRILFLLELERFGRLKVDARLRAEELSVIFYADRDDSAALLRSELPGFEETLRALGYREVWLTARMVGEMPQKQQLQFEALAFGIPPNVHLINVKA